MAKKSNPVKDVADTKPRKYGSRMKSPDNVNTTPTRQEYGEKNPIPDEAMTNPTVWAEKRLESQIPTAALEVEYQLKFGDDKTRRELALEVMAMKGLSSKGPQTGTVVPAIQLIMNGPLPWNQPTLTTGTLPVTVEGTVVTAKVEK